MDLNAVAVQRLASLSVSTKRMLHSQRDASPLAEKRPTVQRGAAPAELMRLLLIQRCAAPVGLVQMLLCALEWTFRDRAANEMALAVVVAAQAPWWPPAVYLW